MVSCFNGVQNNWLVQRTLTPLVLVQIQLPQFILESKPKRIWTRLLSDVYLTVCVSSTLLFVFGSVDQWLNHLTVTQEIVSSSLIRVATYLPCVEKESDNCITFISFQAPQSRGQDTALSRLGWWVQVPQGSLWLQYKGQYIRLWI